MVIWPIQKAKMKGESTKKRRKKIIHFENGLKEAITSPLEMIIAGTGPGCGSANVNNNKAREEGNGNLGNDYVPVSDNIRE